MFPEAKFCFPSTLSVPRGEVEGNIEVSRKQNSLFPSGPVFKLLIHFIKFEICKLGWEDAKIAFYILIID